MKGDDGKWHMFVTEIGVLDKRVGMASAMLAMGIQKSGVAEKDGEVHMIVRKHAEQQEGMRSLCQAVGMREAQGSSTAYRARGGDREQTEAYMYGRAAGSVFPRAYERDAS